MIGNVRVDVALGIIEDTLRPDGVIPQGRCRSGIGGRAVLVSAEVDKDRGVLVLHFHDPDRLGIVLGTDIVVARTDEEAIVPEFEYEESRPAINAAAKRRLVTLVDEIMSAVARYGDDVSGVGQIREEIASMRLFRRCG